MMLQLLLYEKVSGAGVPTNVDGSGGGCAVWSAAGAGCAVGSVAGGGCAVASVAGGVCSCWLSASDAGGD